MTVGKRVNEALVERLFEVFRWSNAVLRGRNDEAVKDAIREVLSTNPEKGEERLPTLSLAVTLLSSGTDVQIDFQRDPKRWTEVRDAILVGIERLQAMISEQNGCPAKPKENSHGR